jgi:hypothetical protein
LIKLHAVADIRKAVVIGAGITGLACAFRLQQLGIPSLILEASAKAGGVISTVRRNGFLFEAGPQCPRFPKSVWMLIRELGLKDEFIAGDPRAKRYILRNGQLHLAPFAAGGLLTTSLVSLKSKYRVLSEEKSLYAIAPKKKTSTSMCLSFLCTHLFSRGSGSLFVRGPLHFSVQGFLRAVGRLLRGGGLFFSDGLQHCRTKSSARALTSFSCEPASNSIITLVPQPAPRDSAHCKVVSPNDKE